MLRENTAWKVTDGMVGGMPYPLYLTVIASKVVVVEVVKCTIYISVSSGMLTFII